MRPIALVLAVLLIVTALPLLGGGVRSGRGYMTRSHTDGVTVVGTGRANSPLAAVAGATGPTTVAVNGIVNSAVSTVATAVTSLTTRVSTLETNASTMAAGLSTAQADATSSGAAIADLQARAPSSAEKGWLATQPMSAEHVTTDTLVGLLPSATTTSPGITRIANWEEEAGGVPLQSNDPRLRSMRAVFVSTATTTASNTSDPTPLVPEFYLGSTVFQPAQMQPGDTGRLEAWGLLDTAASAGTGTLGIVANGTPMGAGGATLGNNLSGRGWHLLVRFTIRDAANAYFDGVWDCGPTQIPIVPQSITYDSTTTQELGLVWTFGTADISNTITCTQITVEALR